MKSLTREWLLKAEGDFEIMESLSRSRRPRLHDGVCFHAQQCAEKYLKARLYEANVSFPPIKPRAVAHVQPLHRTAQVGLRRFHQQVKVVVHQHIGMNPEPEPLGRLPQQLEKVRAVGLIPVNRPSFVAASSHVAAPTRALDA
jgi:hypothetical protein